MTKRFAEYRRFLKADPQLWRFGTTLETDQKQGVPQPDVQKSFASDSNILDLPGIEALSMDPIDLTAALQNRRSHRRFSADPLSQEELAFLLWATQGITGKDARFRTAPSAGARHPFETYLCIHNVQGLTEGIYRYLPVDHQLVRVREVTGLRDLSMEACLGQKFAGSCAVMFVWTVIPYRTEWRYAELSHKVIALDAGHVCQNLYLACEAVGAGTCGVGAYDQEKMDALLGVDGEDEFTIYAAPVGKLPR